MSDSLYEIAENLLTVIQGGMVVDVETGEIEFDSGDLEALSVSMAKKVEAVEMYAEGRRSLAKARREAAKAMMDSAKSLEAQADRLDEYALEAVRYVGGKVETPFFTVSVRKCPPSVSVLDESAIPAEYVREKVTTSIDKAAIKDALKSGEDVPGACLVQNEKLRVC